jgi:hypothetical protein
MTPDMAFECLFVSRDPGLFSTMSRVLRDLSISMDICLNSSRAFDMLGKGSTDLIVIDWEGESSLELLHKIWKTEKWKKPTVVAVSSSDCPVPGAHVVLKKPVTTESGMTSLKAAYSKMLRDYRQHARYALMMPVVATGENGRSVPVTVTDIGDGGVGLCTKQKLVIGDVLSFRLLLPDTPREILIHIRVLWTREYDRVGCEYLRIPPVDLTILHDWLKAKAQIKKPLTAV